ncbi:hypothetical protein N7493_003039 [Penicillium malachiteum]|uniref:GST N-terminal domain-containing protein n=1 Tax=Penicillium malachiteum TaxID=1324776 RepID=A0AAD6HTL3_9EURO|nr:hypothetical protein N7493_003039 [Penicillium malachiteum]
MATKNNLEQTYHLYSYFRSTCTNRVVIAMHLKGIPVEHNFIDLGKAEHESPEFQALNPSKSVPVLVIKDADGNETVITQSIAILEFLEESLPTLTPLLPPSGDHVQRARVREMVNVITNDIQPITNGRIAKRVRAIRGEVKDQFSFVTDVFLVGLTAYEKLLVKNGGNSQWVTQLLWPTSHPVVAGLILDANYSVDQAIILGHVEPGCHNPQGISLGIFGSHSTYSWPRFLQEVPTYLTGHTLEFGHAFGAGHTTGIMAKENSKSWALNFLDHKLNSDMSVDEWDVRDAIRFTYIPFEDFKDAAVKIVVITRTSEGRYHSSKSPPFWDHETDIISITCTAGLAHVQVQNGEEESDEFFDMRRDSSYTFMWPESYNPEKPLKIAAVGLNGKKQTVRDVWAFLEESSYILIPRSTVRLRKRSARSDSLENHYNDFVHWALLLYHRGKDGQIHRATSVDLQVGDFMDGIVVHYADGHHESRGPALKKDTQPYTSVHASQHHGDLPANENITKVVICTGESEHDGLIGIRMTLSNGVHWGCLNTADDDHDIDGNSESRAAEGYKPYIKADGSYTDKCLFTLEPAEDRVVVGFYGQSDPGFGSTHEFGILTVPKDVELPDIVYDMPMFKSL